MGKEVNVVSRKQQVSPALGGEVEVKSLLLVHG